MRKKNIFGAAAVFAAAAVLAGCASGEDGEQRYAYPLGTASPEDTVTQIYAEKFVEEADRLSDGRIKITVYPNSVLGGDRELLESCYDGDIPFVIQNTAPQVSFIDDTAVFDAPCIFNDIESVRETVDKPEFMDDDGISFDINTTPNINMKNLDLLTNYMQNADMLAPDGSVRHLILSEQGFTSACENGEARQAEAIRQAYEIAKANPHVDGFYLTRQVDAQSQEVAGGAFGLWTRDPNASRDEMPLAKKQAWYTYQSLE